jgi:ectoine hydroxylase-related dioxygenase (phytanoyl-CoA dioxygenase family)
MASTTGKRKRGANKAQNSPLPHLPSEFQYLEDRGYQVIPNVLTSAECDAIVHDVDTWMTTSFQTRRDDPQTWKQSYNPNLHQSFHGIIHGYHVGHIQPVWDVRQHPSVVNVFQRLWQDHDLLSAFDGLCVQPPPEWVGSRPNPTHRWYHFDQGVRKSGRHCIQGFVTLEDIDVDDATLCVLERSHHHHDAFFQHHTPLALPKRQKDYRTDWVKLDEPEMKWLMTEQKLQEIKISMPKGSMVLWDSRTAHCSGKPLPGRAHPQRWRHVVYTCYAPRKLATARQLAKHKMAFDTQRTTSHWPLVSKLFGTEPGYPGHFRKCAQLGIGVPQPQLTSLGQRLTGAFFK